MVLASAISEKSCFAAPSLALEKPPRRQLLGMLGVLQAALRDAVFAAEHLPQPPLQPALRKQTAALARAVSAVSAGGACAR